jgi:hypothetical protein
MGGAERVGRRKVLSAAQDALDKTNDLVKRYNEVASAQNKLADKVESIENAALVAKTELTGRLDAQGKWIVKLDTLTGVLEQDIGRHDRDLRACCQSIIERTPETNTFVGRLRWLLTGR